MAAFHSKKLSKNDDWITPKNAWDNIKQFIHTDKVIWEAFYCDGKSGEYLRELGFNVIHKDIDFFENNEGDIVVSNPPYTMKNEILNRLVLLDKPFILIMPVSTLTCQTPRKLFSKNEHKLQVIIPRKRIQFTMNKDGIETKPNRCNFDCFYYCWKIGLDKDITWLENK